MSGSATQPWMAAIEFLSASTLAYGAVLVLHILSMAALVGSALALDLRLLRVSRIASIEEMASHLRPIWYIGMALAILTGILLVLVDPAAYTGNRWFLAKIALLGALILHAMVYARITVLSPHTQWRAGLFSTILWIGLTTAAVMSGQDARPATDLIGDTDAPLLLGALDQMPDQKWIARP